MTRLYSYVGATIPALVVLGFFVWFANWIPQTRWEPPTARTITSDMTPRELAKLGKAIVRERGCLACHTIEPGVGVKGQGRGPNLADVAARRQRGVPAGPDNLTDYLVQTLYEPGAYLVEDYGDIMPVSTRPPAKLTYGEVTAVVAYLQTLGARPSVKVGDLARPPTEARAAPATAAAAPVSMVGGADPEALLAAFNCLDCHSMDPEEVLLGPPFDAALLQGVAETRGVSPEAYVMEAIVRPRAVERDDFPKETMPDDYGERLTAAQLEALIGYLLGERGR